MGSVVVLGDSERKFKGNQVFDSEGVALGVVPIKFSFSVFIIVFGCPAGIALLDAWVVN